MFQLPVNLETDQIRKGTPLPASSQPLPNSVASSAECLQSCQANADCQSWMFDRTAATCTLQSDAADNVYKLGVDSGLRFSWAVDQDAGCLNLVRPGTAPASGGIALCLASDEPLSAWSAGTSDNRNDLYARFAANGSVAGASTFSQPSGRAISARRTNGRAAMTCHRYVRQTAAETRGGARVPSRASKVGSPKSMTKNNEAYRSMANTIHP